MHTQNDRYAINVGLWYRAGQLDVVILDQTFTPHYITRPIEQAHLIPADIEQILDTLRAPAYLRFITCVPPAHQWTKTVVLPHLIEEADAEQRVRFILQNELPLPLDELWYDYCASLIGSVTKIEIFAVVKKLAQDYLANYNPLQIKVLDTAFYALLRAADFLQNSPRRPDTLLIYQDENIAIAMQEKVQQIQVAHQYEGSLTELYEHYCTRHKDRPTRIVVYSTQTCEFPEHWIVLKSDVPLLPLGLALWRVSWENRQQNLKRRKK